MQLNNVNQNGSSLQNIKQNRSVLNPMDATMMAQEGAISPDMTIAQFLQQEGIDVNGPVSQLQQFAKKQVQNANPMTKARNIAQGAGGQSQAPPPAGGGGLEDLIAGMR
jgi:hypothetical protein